MTLETVYYIGQSVAVVVIIATLIAVFYQMRQTTRLARLETSRAVWSDTHHKFESLHGEGEKAALMHKILRTEEKLTSEERVRAGALIGSFLTMYENAHTMATSGLMYDAFWPRMRAVLKHYIEVPRFRRYWSRFRGDFDANAAFQSEIDDLIAEVEKTGEKASTD